MKWNLIPGTLGIKIYTISVKGLVDSNIMPIAYCITEHMLAYFLTKALYGALFVKFRELIMGWKHIDILKMESPSTKEHVGNMYKVESRK